MSIYGPLDEQIFNRLDDLAKAAERERYLGLSEPGAPPWPKPMQIGFMGGEAEAELFVRAVPHIRDMLYALRYLAAENESLKRCLSGEMAVLRDFRKKGS